MLPTLVKIGPFALRSYGLMIALGLFIALQYVVSRAKAGNISQNKIMDLVLYTVVAGLIGARITYVLTNFSYYSRNVADIFKIWEGGLVYYGGLIAGVITVIVYVRAHREIDFWETGDMLAPALSLGQVFGRLGCLLAGCCYGKPTTMLWGVKFTNPASLAPLGVCLHPTQLYEAFGNLAIFLALDRFNKTAHGKGQAVFAYVILYAAIRFVIEFFRGDDRGAGLWIFSQGQLISMVLIAAALSLMLLKRHENNS